MLPVLCPIAISTVDGAVVDIPIPGELPIELPIEPPIELPRELPGEEELDAGGRAPVGAAVGLEETPAAVDDGVPVGEPVGLSEIGAEMESVGLDVGGAAVGKVVGWAVAPIEPGDGAGEWPGPTANVGAGIEGSDGAVAGDGEGLVVGEVIGVAVGVRLDGDGVGAGVGAGVGGGGVGVAVVDETIKWVNPPQLWVQHQ